MTVVPSTGKLLVKQVYAKQDEIKKGGLVLAAAPTDTLIYCRVVEGMTLYEAGTVVLIGTHTGQRITVNGEEMRLLKIEEVWGVVNGFEEKAE